MRTRRFLKRQIGTRRLRKGKTRIGRRTAIHKKGGTNSNRKKQTIRNFLKRDKSNWGGSLFLFLSFFSFLFAFFINLLILLS